METATTRKLTWNPELPYSTLLQVKFANLHTNYRTGQLADPVDHRELAIGVMTVWMFRFRREFADTFDEDLADYLYLGFDDDAENFTISADGPGKDLLYWLTMPLHHLMQAYGYQWMQYHNHCWTLVPA